MDKKREKIKIPSIEFLEAELKRIDRKENKRKKFLKTAGIFAVAAAIAALAATRIFIPHEIHSADMAPAFEKGDIVILLRTKSVKAGDAIGVYDKENLLLRRVIEDAGDYIEIDEEGTVLVNGEEIDEPYLREKTLGKCELDFPYEVPEGMTFVLGDNRAVSIDSRTKSLGCVESDQIVGRVVFRIWPLGRMGTAGGITGR